MQESIKFAQDKMHKTLKANAPINRVKKSDRKVIPRGMGFCMYIKNYLHAK